MSLIEFLTQFTRLTYLAIGVLTLVDYVRRPGRTRLDIALIFGTLGLIVLIQEYITFTGQNPLLLVKLTQLAFMAHPYLLLQLVEHFRPVPAWAGWFTLGGMLVSWVIVLIFPTLPPAATVALVAYFVVVEIYVAAAMIRGAVMTGGVTRKRLLLAASGSGLLAAVIAVAGVNAAFPAAAAYTSLVSQALASLSALAYYFGFAPPRWLRQTWQLAELHRFLLEGTGKTADERASQTFERLCASAVRAVGGRVALAAQWDEALGCLAVRVVTPAAESELEGFPESLAATQGAIGRAWQKREAGVAREPKEFSPEGARLAAVVNAGALFAVPIATPDRSWGLLIVLLQRGPLFPSDDLELLSLFAEQSALALEQTHLYQQQKVLLAEQARLLDHLRDRSAQLEAANRELEAFSYSVSHDLRAPLRHIEGFTDLLLKDGIPLDKRRSHLERIAEAAVRMGRLIDDLLAFSRLGRAGLDIKPVSLSRVLEEARRELQAEAEGRDVVWTIASLPQVEADAALLRQVFVNLLSNALKYSRARAQARIEVGTRPGEADKVVIYVRDNGVGFDMQYSDKLFGVFQRLHHSDEFEGTGIGLANVRRIVHRHGGLTWAEASPEGGATFYFSLPLAVRAEPGPDPQAEPMPAHSIPQPETAGR